jgi:AcrR family transcriptional regulator
MLDAACAVFGSEGFDRASMEAIAERAGTTKPTLYARFGSKDDLFAAAVHREYELLKARLFAVYEAGAEDPFRIRLKRWNAAYFDFVRERPDGFRLSSEGERYPAAAAAIERANDEIIEHIVGLIAGVSGRPARGGAHLVASMIVGMLNWCARETVRRGDADLDDAAALCESFLYAALRGLDPDLMDAVDPV